MAELYVNVPIETISFVINDSSHPQIPTLRATLGWTNNHILYLQLLAKHTHYTYAITHLSIKAFVRF